MTAQILSGAYGCFACVLALAGAFFIEAFRHRRRDVSYLIFGIASIAFAIYAAAAAAIYWVAAFPGTLSLRTALRVAAGSGIVSIFAILHFALRYTGHPAEQRVLRWSYPAMVVILVTLAIDPNWVSVPSGTVSFGVVAGLEAPILDISLSLAGKIFVSLVVVVMVAMIVLIARAHLRGHAEGPAPLIGSALLAVAAVNDALGGAVGLYDSVMLVPFGFVLFVFGMSVTLVNRYVQFADDLARRSDELAQRTAELTSSLHELQQTQQELLQREQLAMVGELASVITHEVRNPMSVVQDAVRGLRLGAVAPEDGDGPLTLIEEEMARLNSLVTNLLVLARPVAPQRAPWDVAEAIDEALGLAAGERAAAVEVLVSVSRPAATVDRELMREVLVNVIRNAIDAASGPNSIRIVVDEAERDGQRVLRIAVRDAGEGMTADQVAQAVTPFFSTRRWGTGLGLSLCDRIVEAHGGKLAIESHVGRGTTVTIELPEPPDETSSTEDESRSD